MPTCLDTHHPCRRSPGRPCGRPWSPNASGIAALFPLLFLAACGGSPGGGASDGDAARRQAAQQTAEAHPRCVEIRPFYWEIGDRSGTLASGSVPGGGVVGYDASTVMPIASASKWLYGSYVVQRAAGALSAEDVHFLTFVSGYTSFTSCQSGQTVGECAEAGSNGVYNAADDGFFDYGGGHMQQHAARHGLGGMDSDALAAEVRRVLGSDLHLSYGQPQLAGGAHMPAADYARFLRRILDGSLAMRAALGSHAVCTNPDTCAQARQAPTPRGESWHYAIGHWVEDDPVVGDGAFSSPGLFGFYPWIDRSRSWYGIVARVALPGALDSVECGRLIRKAWLTGTPP